MSERLRSPNAIPPRTSSTGQSFVEPTAAKPVLKPVSESDWIGQKTSSQSNSSTSPKIPAERTPKSDMAYQGKGSWSAEKEKILQGPYEYLISQPGKGIRTQLISAFNEWLEVPPDSLEIITKAVGMLHTASLLVDDVEDSSVLRRGLPVAHSIFGTAQTINCANYVYFCALQELQKLRNPKAITIFTEELLNLHRGQGMDLFWRDSLTCPTEDDYLEMVGNKTGGLFRLGIKLMQAESKSLKYFLSIIIYGSIY
jgi:geranylgeranyl diphosphate synthase, type III